MNQSPTLGPFGCHSHDKIFQLAQENIRTAKEREDTLDPKKYTKDKCKERNVPSVFNGDHAADFLRDFLEDRHGQVEVLLRLVTPAAIRARRTEVGGGNDYGGRPFAILGAAGVAGEFKASAAREAGVEKRLAQRCGVGAVACAVKVAVSARSACTALQSVHCHNIQDYIDVHCLTLF